MDKLRILAQSAAALGGWRLSGRLAAMLLLMGVGIVAAFGLAPDTLTPDVPMRVMVRDLPRPAVASLAQAKDYWHEERIQRGDTLGAVLARLSVADPASLAFIVTDAGARSLYQLRPGKSLRVHTDDEGRLIGLSYLAAGEELLAVDRVGEGFAARTLAPQVTARVELRGAEIASSLFAAADSVALPDAVTMQIADVFSGEIDFLHDLRRGDRFAVLYELREVEGQPVATGRILAAEFVNRGVVYRAFLWRAPDGTEGYYTEDGKNLRRAFLRSPVEFSRITSGFSLARFQPFLRTWQAHKGVDFAAPTGTPVHAAGDGQVVVAAAQNGYGNVVILRHRGAYSTLYAHLSRFAPGVRTGTRVEQGAVIGYVGQTGWATGPHLHYEFRVDGVARNPLTIAFADGEPISAADMAAYHERSAPLAAQLALGRGMTLAGAD